MIIMYTIYFTNKKKEIIQIRAGETFIPREGDYVIISFSIVGLKMFQQAETTQAKVLEVTIRYEENVTNVYVLLDVD